MTHTPDRWPAELSLDRPWLDGDAPFEVQRLLLAAREQEPPPEARERAREAARLAATAMTVSSGFVVGWQLLRPLRGLLKWSTVWLGGALLAVAAGASSSRWGDAADRSGPPLVRGLSTTIRSAPQRALQRPSVNLSLLAGADGEGASVGAGAGAAGKRRVPNAGPATKRDEPRVTAHASAAKRHQRMSDGIARQVALLERARQALAEAAPRRALLLLDRYDSDFESRHFDPEALFLRHQAQVALGARQDAERAAHRLVSQHPYTEQARQVRRAHGPSLSR